MDGGCGVINRHRPIITSNVPVELVVIREKACAIAYGVDDLDGSRGVNRTRNVDFQISIIPRSFRLILQPLPTFGDTFYVKEKCVVRRAWPRIFDGNGAVNSVPFTYEHQRDTLVNGGRAIVLDCYRVFEIGDAPGAGKERGDDSENPE